MPILLPDLGLVTAVIALLIIAGALWVLQQTIGRAFSYVPVIGSWVSSHLDSALNDARNAVLKAAGSTWDGAVHLFNWAGDVFERPFNALVSTFADVTNWIERTATVTIPAVYNRIVAETSRVLADAYNRAETLFRTAERDITAAEAAVTAKAFAWYNDARGYAARLTADAEDLALSEVRAAERIAAAATAALAAEVRADVTALVRDIVAAELRAEQVAISTADGYARVLYTDLDGFGTQALQRVWPDAEQDIGALRQALGGSFPNINELLGALGGLGAAGLLGALIRSLAGTSALTQLATDCIVPNCRNLSQFGRDLQGLIGDVPAAAMLAWMIFLVTDPAGWAQDTYDLGGPVSRTVTTAAADLFRAA